MIQATEIRTEYPCCGETACPQHVQAYQERTRTAEADMMERRFAGNTNVRKSVYGGAV